VDRLTSSEALQYCVLYKPFGVLSQFSEEDGHPGLASLDLGLPKDVYPVGRLDRDSEGLLLLTNDKAFNSALLAPENGHRRTYWVQVEGSPTAEGLRAFNRPMQLKIKGKWHVTAPAEARLMDPAPEVPERMPPVRFRKSVPDAWVELVLTEGKNRQVRKMTAHAGFPTLRLIRVSIGRLDLMDLGLRPGELAVLERDEVTSKIGLKFHRPKSDRRQR
jgi:23S rRNA pseudouridine2457 synthase